MENPEILNRIESLLIESLKPKDEEEKDAKDVKDTPQDSGLLDLDEPMDFLPQIDPETGEIIE